jgi:lycopene cyclase domain-containing protein
MEYLLVEIGILLTGLFLVWKYKLKLFKSVGHAVITLLTYFLLIIIFDSIAIFYGWWAFPGPGTLGIKIGLLVIEEYSFGIIIPWFIIVFYKFVEKKVKK